MEIFYNEKLDEKDKSLIFGLEESRHLIKVLRKKVGELINVTNGRGLEWKGEIISTDSHIVTLNKTGAVQHLNQILPIHIAIAPTKSNDRLEFFLEKAVEIGITQITPIICEHSERKTVNYTRMKKILVRAIKQSAQYFLPQLNLMVSFEDLIKFDNTETRLLAHCQKGNKMALHQIGNLNKEILIMIGPEGDFSNNEIKIAQNHSFRMISLGQNRLRTETAGIIACNTVATLREISKIK